jgi:hypothetical protein
MKQYLNEKKSLSLIYNQLMNQDEHIEPEKGSEINSSDGEGKEGEEKSDKYYESTSDDEEDKEFLRRVQ